MDTIKGNAQFILQNDLTIPKDYDGSKIIFKGTLHGNGHIINGLRKDQALFAENQGKIYNLGLATGSIATKGCTTGISSTGTSSTGEYHCCFEYAPATSKPVVYGMDGKANSDYTLEDFKYGKVAYDLNGYYLRARTSHNKEEDKAALKYIYDYYANGDYQYAHRKDAITGKNTGITYLRTGQDSDLPNYGQTETRHDQNHAIDKARAQGYTAATDTEKESRTGYYLPLFNENKYGSELMNDFLFWGQSLQSTPEDYPAKIASQQNKYMINRVYRTDGYYGSKNSGKFYYNAYNQDGGKMGTYVHLPATTAINFAASDDNATSFYDFIIKDGVTRNLLVYTEGNKEDNTTDAYDIVSKALSYDENTAESLIMGHHIVKSGEAYTTQKLHLVERTPDGKNSEGDACDNNDFCVPIQFSVTDHAWYIRKPLYYAENTKGAWEGICLPFTVQKAEASINGEITHFYRTEDLRHEYWLRGLTEVKATNTVNTVNAANATEKTAIFQRPGAADDDGLFHVANAETQKYEFHNTFFVDTYKAWSYNEEKNSYYNEPHTYSGYLPLTAGIPYVVRFPGERYYEFDLSPELFAMLKDLRSDMSKKHKLPPYVVFQDVSLEQMATMYPVDLQELQNIQGVGAGKAKRYGKEFCALIKKYCEENDIERPEELRVRTVAKKSMLKVSIIQSIDRQIALDDLAEAKGLDFDDLLDEIEAIVYSGTKLNIDYFIEEVIDDEHVDDIYDYFMESDTDDLDTAQNELGEDYSEDEIRLVRIKFLSEQAN